MTVAATPADKLCVLQVHLPAQWRRRPLRYRRQRWSAEPSGSLHRPGTFSPRWELLTSCPRLVQPMDIPHTLKEQIREGKVVLFLGSGATIGASHPANLSAPDGRRLAETLADKFLGPSYRTRPSRSSCATSHFRDRPYDRPVICCITFRGLSAGRLSQTYTPFCLADDCDHKLRPDHRAGV